MQPIVGPLRLSGGTVLRDGVLQRRSVAVAGGRVARGPFPEIDMTGFLILPGIVDLHGLAGEGGWRPVAEAAAAAGVTTLRLVQDWSWAGGAFGPAAARARAQEIARAAAPAIDLGLAIRCEAHTVGTAEDLIGFVGEAGVDHVVFRDTLWKSIELSCSDPAGFRAEAAAAGRSEAEYFDALRCAKATVRDVPRHLCRLAAAFDSLGVVYGSVRDPDAETRERYAMIGARVAVAPASRRAAVAARAMGDPVVVPAASVLSGDAAALEAVTARPAAVITSDGDFAALSEAVYALADRGLMDFATAWSLVSSGPSGVLRLPDRGRLDPGRRADLVAVDEATRRVELVMSGGRIAYLAGGAEERLRHGAAGAMLAAE